MKKNIANVKDKEALIQYLFKQDSVVNFVYDNIDIDSNFFNLLIEKSFEKSLLITQQFINKYENFFKYKIKDISHFCLDFIKKNKLDELYALSALLDFEIKIKKNDFDKLIYTLLDADNYKYTEKILSICQKNIFDIKSGYFHKKMLDYLSSDPIKLNEAMQLRELCKLKALNQDILDMYNMALMLQGHELESYITEKHLLTKDFIKKLFSQKILTGDISYIKNIMNQIPDLIDDEIKDFIITVANTKGFRFAKTILNEIFPNEEIHKKLELNNFFNI